MQFTDSHCHLDFPKLYQNNKFSQQALSQLLASCQAKNIKRIIVPSTDPANWQQILSLPKTEQSVSIYKALGIHPWYLAGLTNFDLDLLAAKIDKHRQHIIALGEAGIDGTIAMQQNNFAKQVYFFEAQVSLANQFNLPLIIHHRRSHPELVKSLKQRPAKCCGIVHAFSGSYQQAKTYVDMGFKLGIGGTISYVRAKKTINAIKRLPVESLVLETDAPSMPLDGFQGQANSPLHTVTVFEYLAAIREESKEVLAAQLEKNVSDVLGI